MTPVRATAGSSRRIVAWPTRTPGTSVIVLRGPGVELADAEAVVAKALAHRPTI